MLEALTSQHRRPEDSGEDEPDQLELADVSLQTNQVTPRIDLPRRPSIRVDDLHGILNFGQPRLGLEALDDAFGGGGQQNIIRLALTHLGGPAVLRIVSLAAVTIVHP
jgi:hypothetical protein